MRTTMDMGGIDMRLRTKLLPSSPDDVARYDIAHLNLLCAEGLPGAETLDIDVCLRTLTHWSDGVKRFVQDCRPQFEGTPAEYQNHEGFWSFLSMVTLLKHPRGLRVSYQPRAIDRYDFSDSRDDMLHGLLTRRLGTCASLPVLFVAIGRRLGWPLHLAVAKRHVFCQWLNPDGTRLNLEGSCPGGGQMYPDKHYRTWPGALTRDELASGRYLRPLSGAECFALFLETRGHCLVDNRRYGEAHEAYATARQFAPQWSQFEDHIYALKLHRQTAGTPQAPKDGATSTSSMAPRLSSQQTFRVFETVTELSGVQSSQLKGVSHV